MNKYASGGRGRLSLVYKLNTRLLCRLVLLFLALDLFLAAALAAGLLLDADRTVKNAVAAYQTHGFPGEAPDPWTEAAGYRILRVSDERAGVGLPDAIQALLPDHGADGRRSIDQAEDGTFVYRYDFIDADRSYSVQVRLGERLAYLLQAGRILLIAEGVALLFWFIGGIRLARRTMQPFADLAETARNLNRGGPAFSVDKMESLADRLDAINAARLDTRIPLGETQDELRSLAEAINGMLERINEAYRSQARFVSDASHELRTPISVIQGYANLLDRWGKNDETALQESIDAILEETANMKGLIEQLLFLARGDNDSMPLQMETFDLSEIGEEVLRETRMIDSAHEYEARFTGALVTADKGLVKQALRILTDNAIKYTNAGGRIVLAVSAAGQESMVTVQDEGIGIPPEAVPLIFERFFRTDSSRARSTGGAGLGLSIAKWIAERHGGRMEVLSRQDLGTRITLALPRAPQPAEALAGELETKA